MHISIFMLWLHLSCILKIKNKHFKHHTILYVGKRNCLKVNLSFYYSLKFRYFKNGLNCYKMCRNCFTFYFTNRCYYSSNQQGVKLKVETVTLFFRVFSFLQIGKAFYFIFMSTRTLRESEMKVC